MKPPKFLKEGFVMVTNNISIGQKIRTIRKRKGFTQAMLAEVIGRSPTYIS